MVEVLPTHQPDELGNFSGTGDVDEATARALFLLRMELAAKRPFPQLPGTIAWRTQDGANEHAPRSQDLSALTGKKPVRQRDTRRHQESSTIRCPSFPGQPFQGATLVWLGRQPHLPRKQLANFHASWAATTCKLYFNRRCRLFLLFVWGGGVRWPYR